MTYHCVQALIDRLQQALNLAPEANPGWLKQELLEIAHLLPDASKDELKKDELDPPEKEQDEGAPNPKRQKKEKAQRPFQFHKFKQRYVALEIMYVGWRFQGFARQDSTDNTIEAHLFHALKKTRLIPEDADAASIRYSRCGRTDKGVSAAGQVVALLLRSAAREDESSGDPHTTRAGAPVPGAHQHNRAEGSLTRPSSSRGSNGQGPGSRAEAGFGPAAGAAAAVAEGLSGMGMEVGTQRDQGMEASSSSGGGSGSSGAPLCALPPAEQELDYPHLLNKVLPEEIRVLGWRPVPDEFHARFSTSYRQYKYFIVSTGQQPPPHASPPEHPAEGAQALHEECDFDLCSLDIARMRDAAQHFVGEHDFRNFCKPDVLAVRSFVRRIMSFEIEPVDVSGTLDGNTSSCPSSANIDCGRAGSNGRCRVYVMTIRGTAFLWHQVRCMAAVLLLVGRGLEHRSIVAQMLDLEKFPAKPQYAMAPEEPLLLHDCGYNPPLSFLPPHTHFNPPSSGICSMVEKHLTGAALCAAIAARSYKREAEGLDAGPGHGLHQSIHGEQQQQQQQLCTRSGQAGNCSAGTNDSRGTAGVHGGSGKQGGRHPGGQLFARGNGVGPRYVRNYVPLHRRPMEQSIDERLQKHGLVSTEQGFQRIEDGGE